MSNFNDEYQKLRKKRLAEENSQAPSPSFSSRYLPSNMYGSNNVGAVESAYSKDIAPVKEKDDEDEQKEKWYQGWFQGGAFEDGYDFGDVTKTILGTVNDVSENVTTAVVDATENLIDTGAYAVGLFGNKDFKEDVGDFIAKDLLKSQKTGEVLNAVLNPVGSITYLLTGGDTEGNSLLSDKTDSLVQSAAHMVGSYALQTVGVPWWLTQGVNAFGSSTEEAFQEDASYGEAAVYGGVSVAAEIITEKLFAGSGLDEVGFINTSGLTKGISNKLVKTLADYGINMGTEAAEEVLAQIATNAASATFKDEDVWSLLTNEEAMNGYIESAIGGAAIGGGMNVGKVGSSIKTGRDYNTGLTANEQKVFDAEYNKRIAEKEADGNKLSKKDKAKIYDEVMNDLEKGYISTDTIEEVLGGDDYKSYQDTVKNEDALKKELDELRNMKNGDMTDIQTDRLNELKGMNLTDTTKRNELKTKLSESVFSLAKDTKLSESYNERVRRGQAYEADLTAYDTKQAEIIQKAIDSGILNNTNRTHEFVDMVAKISADKGVSFDFANNAKLKESGFAIDGKTINGYVTKDGVTVNIDSAKSLNSVVGHEITHVLEGTELYAELSKAAVEYAKSKGEYDSRRRDIWNLYKNTEGFEVKSIDSELVADLVGDYLFTDNDFIMNLSTKNRNVFQKIYDEIKYLLKIATAGSKEARELEKVKKAFEAAYKESGKTEGTKYSLSDSDGKQLTKEQNEYFKDSKMRDENGNLKVMYHGSQNAGFHVFDPAHSDDGISLFFVDRNDVATSYSGTSETYEAQTIRSAEDMNNFIESIGVEDYEVVEKDGKFTLIYEGMRVAEADTARGIYEEFCWYEGVGEGDANYKVYLNLTNPLEIDAKGRPWNKIDAEFSQEVYDKYNSLTAEEKETLADLAGWEDFMLFNRELQDAALPIKSDDPYITNLAQAYYKMGEDFNIYDLFSVASDNFSEEAMRENARKYLKTRDFAQRAKEGGYDGVILKNVIDNGGYSNGSEGASTVAIAFNSEQVKSVANEKPTADKDIRYSLSDTETKTLSEAGLEYDAKSETVSFSLSSLEDSFNYHTDDNGIVLNENDYQRARDEYVNALAKSIAADKTNPTAEEKMKASKYLDGLFLVHDMIAADKDRLDYEAAVDKSAWVSNSEYGGSIDFSTLCAKRRLFTGTFDAIQNALPDTVLDENDFLRIRDMLLEKELESPCSMCYVEGSRAKHGVYVDKWLKEYLATNPEWKPQIADFTSSTRLERTRIEHPEAYAAYQKAMNKLAQRKPKEASVRTDYKGEILVAFEDGSSVEIKNQNGGIRFNSFSDFEIIHALDCMQVITDMARVGLNGQAYTKVKEFAESFGDTGLKINLSLVAKDVDANGKLIMDEVNGMKYSEAMEIRNKHSDNVGTVIVVFNDAQLRAALSDSTIDYVLPFHRSQWKKSQYTMMGLPTVTKDYTALQNDRIRNPKTGKPVKLSKLKQATTYTNDITGETYVIKDNIMPNMYWDYSKSGRDNANRYLDYINANGMTPKFDFLLDKVDGKWTLPEDAVGDGYFKLLIDFKMYNNEGWGAPQNPVLPEFNMPYIQQMLDNYIGGHQSFPVAHDVVDKFVDGKKNGQFSLTPEGETPKSYGTWNVFAKDILLDKGEIAPTQDSVQNTVDEAVDNSVDEAVAPDYAEDEAMSMREIYGEEYEPIENAYTIEQEFESVRDELKAVYEEYNALKNEGKDAEAQPLFDKWLDLNARARELFGKAQEYKAEDKGYLDSLTDEDAPPEVEAPYNLPKNTITLKDKALDKVTKQVNDILGLDAEESAEMAKTIQRYAQNENMSESELFEEIKKDFQFHEEISNDTETLSAIKKRIRGTKIFVPADLKADFNGKRKDGFNGFRQENFGRFTIKTKDTSGTIGIDQLYQDLAEAYPEYFPDDIWNPADQLIQIADVVGRGANIEYASMPFDDETIQEVCDVIINGINKYSHGEIQSRLDVDRNKFYESIGVVEDIAPTFDTARKDQNVGQQTMYDDSQLFDDTETEEEPPKIAKVLESTPKTPKKVNLITKIRNLVFDKQSVIEDISLKTKNRELMGKADFMLRSESRAQRHIKNKLMPILERVEATGNRQAYEEYAYHLHNIDRMSLEGKAQARIDELKGKFENLKPEQIRAIAAKKITENTTERTANTIREAKEYLNALETKNKPVFGDSVTADVSREFVKNFEAEHKDAREISEAITEYNNELRQMLVDGGIISKETADLWAEMYPHYVPIRRAGKDGAAVKVPLDTMRTGVNAPIARAKGGNSDIESLLDVMGSRTEQVYRAVARNSFGVELMHTLDTVTDTEATSIDEILDSFETEELLKKGENGANPTFTVFEDGKRITFDITEELYDALKPTNDLLKTDVPIMNLLTKIQRGILTQYNPTFIATNAAKDMQDVLVNSQHAGKTYANVPLAAKELFNSIVRHKDGKWITEYMDNGGEDLTYFDSKTQTFKKDESAVKKVLGFVPNGIAKANDFVEKIPRLAEYIASRKKGASIEVAMLDAARVTTNFAAGGDLTKFANKNGFTFLNASIQGFNQQVRNVREAKANGLKGVMQLAAKFAVAGLPVMLLNAIRWEDDEEYEELSDYIKDNYYIVAKTKDGKFVRIPKGRAVAVIQNAFEQMKNLITGDDEVDMARFGELMVNNLAPNNPLENNILAPIGNVINNKTWYGEDLVPTRLQDLPAAEQFDETTDSISKWLGEVTNTSPYKWNYILDQYSGGVGDVILPMLTPESDGGGLLAPVKDKFTTDSVMKNQNVSDFYEKVDELTKNANSMKATDEDVLMSKYMNSISAELGELYKQKREIQSDTSISDAAKDKKVREIQEQINELAKESLNTYADVSIDGQYATVGDLHYRWYEPSEDSDAEAGWQKVSDKQLEKQDEVTSGLGITPSEYWSNKEEYDYAYDYPGKYAVSKAVGGYKAYKSYSSELYDIKADKDEDGKSISGSRKEKVIEYINNLDADYGTKIILFKSEYNADDTYNYDIIDYLNSRDDISYKDMETILKELGFTVSSDGNISWD